MARSSPDGASEDLAAPPKRRLPRPSLSWAVWTALLLVLGAAAWIAVRGLQARQHLERAKAQVARIESAALDGNLPAAQRRLQRVQRDTRAARSLTHDPVWSAAAALPWLGDMPQAVSSVSEAIDDVTQSALPPLLRSAADLDVHTLLRAGRVDTRPLLSARPTVHRAAVRTARADNLVRSAQSGWLLGPVRRSVADVRSQTRRLRQLTARTDTSLAVLPALLGSEGRRSYLIAIQNPAEARGTGGLMGAYAVVDVQDGALRLRRIGSNTDLHGARRPVVDLGRDYAQLYGADPGLWLNANLSPHFPYAARQWLGLWNRQFHEQLAGVVAVDPYVLGYLVEATGPVPSGGGAELTAADTARFFMHDIYVRYPALTDNARRDRAANRVGARIVANLLGGSVDSAAVVRAGQRATEEGRLLVYSTDPAVERVLVTTPLGGGLPARTQDTAVIVNNGGGNKLDYYLRGSTTWALGACTDTPRQQASRLVVTLTNEAPARGLPAWVVGEPITGPDGAQLPAATNRPLVYVYGPAGARLRGATLDGAPLAVRFGRERGHPVYAFPVELRPGARATVVLRLTAPQTAAEPRLRRQALVQPLRSVVTGAACVG